MDVSLRKITEGDWYVTVPWRNQNAEFFPHRDKELTMREHLDWYHDVYTRDPADHMFVIYADRTPVGTIAFNSQTREIGRVMLGNKAYRRQGIMSEALSLLMQSFRADWYHLKVLRNNESAIAFYKQNYFAPFRNNYGPEGDGDFVYMERESP